MAIVKLIFSQVPTINVYTNGNITPYTQTLSIVSTAPTIFTITPINTDSIIILNCYNSNIRYKTNSAIAAQITNQFFRIDNICIIDTVYKVNGGNLFQSYYFKLVLNPGTATGISDLKLNTSKLTVFPNPAIDEVNVSFTANKEKTPIEVFDIQGRLVMLEETEREIGVNKVSLNISNFSAGIYIVRAGSETFKITKI